LKNELIRPYAVCTLPITGGHSCLTSLLTLSS